MSWMSAEQAAAWHAVVAASIGHDLPGESAPTPEQVHARLTTAAPDGRRLFWLAAEDDGAVVGVAGLRLFTEQGRDHLAELELHVHPDRRRRGVGSHLLTTAIFAVQVERRRGLLTSAVADGPGDAFCAARGFLRHLTLSHVLLDLAGADDSAADASHPGYERIAEIESVNAEDDARVLAVNRRLGFLPYRRTHEYRLDVTP
ncbi:GNAT superfamily N-acetyltransferase [Nonomuraea dietziae]|uniref:GNAT superfamily N-acetyltransferase n=1 Tax=Nonomuraea dietziae TaxID=65515 RepID=A0A7W5VDD9_9ACTN|nr:GNAT superfamily N-acetyltransferase [Nonomuraea dietziae]